MSNSQQAPPSSSSGAGSGNGASSVGRTLNAEMIACLEEELQRCSKNTKNTNAKHYVMGLRKAISSLEKYPKKLYNGNEAKTLKGIGDKMAYKIDKYLKDNNIDLGIPPTNAGGSIMSQQQDDSNNDDNQTAATKRKRSNRKYVPKFKTAAWAIMISLYRHTKENDVDYATKTKLIALCEALTDVPMEQSTNGSQYTGWSSIKTLLDKELIIMEKRGRSNGFIFTKKGRKLARKLHKAEKEVSERDFSWEESEEEMSSSEEEEPKEKPAKKKKKKQPASSVGSSVLLGSELSQSSQQSESETINYDSDPELCLDIYSQLGFQPKTASSKTNECSQTSQTSHSELSDDDDEIISEVRKDPTPITVSSSSSLSTVYTILSDDEDDDVTFDYSKLPLKFSYLDKREKPVNCMEDAKFHFTTSAGEIRLKVILKSPLQNEECLGQIFDEIIEKKQDNNELTVIGFIRESRCVPYAHNLAKNLIIDPTLFKFYNTTNKPTDKSQKENHTKVSSQTSTNMESHCSQQQLETSTTSPTIEPFKPILLDIELSDEEEDCTANIPTVPPSQPICTVDNPITQQESSKKKKQKTSETQENRINERESRELSQRRPPSVNTVPRPREMIRTFDFSQMPPPSFIPARTLVHNQSTSSSSSSSHSTSSNNVSNTNHIPTTPAILNSNRQPLTIVNLKSFLENPVYNPSFSITSPDTSTTKSSDLPKEPYNIHLVIDQRERTNNNDRKTFCDTLKKRGADSLISQLGMGDVIWTLSTEERSYVLNYVLERKDINDLAGSIKDGRYKEQKFRMNNSNCSNIFYLIERGFKQQDQLSQSSLETSIRKILTDGIAVKHTPSLESSINFLILMNSLIVESVERDGLTPHQLLIPHDVTGEMYNPSLEEYNILFKKNNDIPKNEIFGRQLTTIQGLSSQIAESIIKKYPTPSSLCQVFLDSPAPQEMALKNFPIESSVDGVCTRKIGTKLSQKIYQYFFQD